MKRINVLLCTMLVLAITLSGMSFAGDQVINLSKDTELLYSVGILKGDGTGLASLEMNKKVNRLSCAIVAMRLDGVELQAKKFSSLVNYSDAIQESWAIPELSYIKANENLGWVVADNKFDPRGSVSVEEFAAVLYNVLGYTDEDLDLKEAYREAIALKQVTNQSSLTYGEFSIMTVEALNSKIEDSKVTVAENLVEKGLINRRLADQLNLVTQFDNNLMTAAIAWKQTAAEYKALYYQGYNVARLKVDEALANWKEGDKPLAVVTDMDDTIISPVNYWGYLVDNSVDFFDDPIWDGWIPKNKMVPTPGALDFFNYCEEKGVEVFYVTSRNQGENTYEYALEHLKILEFPFADTEHLTVLRETSNKEKVHVEIAKSVDFIVKLGDSLNDFNRSYYIKEVDQRILLMEKDKDLYGNEYILFPNPTDGHWVSAIFGESEPPANNANRQIWKDAAMKNTWDGK